MSREIEIAMDLERSMRVEVKIPRDEVDRIVVNRLIGIRNSIVNRDLDMSHVDKTLRIFLTEEEFKRYVIDQEKIEY